MPDNESENRVTVRANALARQMGLLFTFARKMNELDFAGSLSGEFRGAQDAGWSTTLTSEQVFGELVSLLESDAPNDLPRLRIALLLYSQLAEAGGTYETLKNLMRLIEREPYNMWPFRELVRVRSNPDRIIGPNANRTFKDLAEHARRIGMLELSEALETVFRDDVRNAIAHADYVIWSDGLRLRRRNGGRVERLRFEEVSEVIGIGVAFFQILRHLASESIRSFNPPREITGRFSANPPMTWTVAHNQETGAFSIQSASAGPVQTSESLRQEEINRHLSGNAIAIYRPENNQPGGDFNFSEQGFEPTEIFLSDQQFSELLTKITNENLWDDRFITENNAGVLCVSPWGFKFVSSQGEVDEMIGDPEFELVFDEPSVDDGGEAQ